MLAQSQGPARAGFCHSAVWVTETVVHITQGIKCFFLYFFGLKCCSLLAWSLHHSSVTVDFSVLGNAELLSVG